MLTTMRHVSFCTDLCANMILFTYSSFYFSYLRLQHWPLSVDGKSEDTIISRCVASMMCRNSKKETVQICSD